MLITTSSLYKTYYMGNITVEALKDINVIINEGELISIMGPSGSGKSTLMNILGCLDRPTSGEYVLDGINVSGLDDSELAYIRNKRIGFVFQSFNLIPRYTALQNVELPMIYAGIPSGKRKETANVALEKVGMIDRADHRPNELSGGQKQRVAIARALVNQPSILLADEPTGNLDSVSGDEIISIFKDLNAEGVTIIIVTHELSVAKHTNRTISFFDGVIVKDVPSEDHIEDHKKNGDIQEREVL